MVMTIASRALLGLVFLFPIYKFQNIHCWNNMIFVLVHVLFHREPLYLARNSLVQRCKGPPPRSPCKTLFLFLTLFSGQIKWKDKMLSNKICKRNRKKRSNKHLTLSNNINKRLREAIKKKKGLSYGILP